MKIKTIQTALFAALQQVCGAVSTRSVVPVLSCALLEARDGKMFLTATDTDVRVRTELEGSVEEDGSIMLPVAKLRKMVSMVKGDVTIRTDKETVVFECGNYHSKIFCISPDEFPIEPQLEAPKHFSVDQALLKNGMSRVFASAAGDAARIALNSVLFHFHNGNLTLATTDGRRLTIQDVVSGGDTESLVLIPLNTATILSGLLSGGSVEISATDNAVNFEIGNIRLYSRLVDSKFPEYEKVVPTSHKITATIKREEFLAALKRIALMTEDKMPLVECVFSGDSLKMNSSGVQGEAHETVAAVSDGSITISFDPKYLIQSVTVLEGDSVELQMDDNTTPLVVVSKDFKAVIMPINLK